ncbi:MAG: hypothetical protein Kow0037_02420 [Calditrichia bacterium]
MLTRIILALLLCVAFLWAQGNQATVSQKGDGNQADVNQQGATHQVIITQDTWGTGHKAVVNQNSGASNFGDILQDQRGAEVYLDQVGSNNEARLKQSGPNLADIDQTGNGNILGQYSDLSKKAFQKNGTSFSDDQNWLYLTQTGNGNTAGLWQEHHATATIKHIGDNNNSGVFQSGSPAGSKNEATIDVTGNANTTDINQFGEGNKASVTLDYYGDAGVAAEFNNVDVDQNGNSNRSTNLIKGQNNIVTVSQTQNGSWHVLQIFGSDNNATITADGINNRGFWLLNGQADLNNLDVSMTGDDNIAGGHIQGDDNDVDVVQTGNDNLVGTDPNNWNTRDGVVILGNQNTVDIQQLSNANAAVVNQTGDNNNAVITQN